MLHSAFFPRSGWKGKKPFKEVAEYVQSITVTVTLCRQTGSFGPIEMKAIHRVTVYDCTYILYAHKFRPQATVHVRRCYDASHDVGLPGCMYVVGGYPSVLIYLSIAGL
jgi:hypothetical protein